MQYKEAEIAQTVYFWFAANEVTGTAGDGASPLFDVRLAGAAANAAPTASGTPTLLTHADYSPGLFEIAVDSTGYAAGEYAVFCTLTISTVNPAGFVGSFRLKAAGASIHSIVADLVNGGRLDLLIDAIKAITDQMAFTTDGANKYVKADSVFVAGAAPEVSADIAAAVRDVAIAGAAASSVGAAIASILTDTAEIGTAGAGLTTVAIGVGGIATTSFAAGAMDAAALAADAGTEIAAAIKAAIVETQGNYTVQQVLSIVLAACAGITADAGATLKTPNGAATRIAATIDGSNNRTAMTLTPSA
jgi:hypothetical protein